MALQITSQNPRLEENIGQFTPFATGIVSSTGTSTTVTVTRFTRVDGVVVTNGTSVSTLPFVATTSGNQFTVTHGSGDEFMYICWGIPKA